MIDHEAPRRRPDGSIDTDFYCRIALSERRAALARVAERCTAGLAALAAALRLPIPPATAATLWPRQRPS